MKKAVVYYSRTGHVRKAASILSKELGAEIIEIIDKDKRAGALGFIKSGKESTKKQPADIEKISQDFNDYDLVVLCSPVWAGNMSPPARAFLNNYGKEIKDISYLLLHGTKNEYMEVINEMDSIMGKTRKSYLSLPVRSDVEKEVHEFVSKLT